MKKPWYWILLSSLAVVTIIVYLYFESGLIMSLYFSPPASPSGELEYHKGLGLFAPILYGAEGVAKGLQALSPLATFFKEVLLLINSLLLLASLPVSYYVFKKKVWAGIVIVLLSLPVMIIGFTELYSKFSSVHQPTYSDVNNYNE